MSGGEVRTDVRAAGAQGDRSYAVFALLTGPAYALAVGLLTGFFVKDLALVLGRELPLEWIVVGLVATNLGFVVGLVGGLMVLAPCRTPEASWKALGRLWKWLSLSLPILVGLTLVWAMSMHP